MAKGAKDVGDRFSKGEVFLVELVMAGGAMKAGMSILLPKIREARKERKTLGKVVIVLLKVIFIALERI